MEKHTVKLLMHFSTHYVTNYYMSDYIKCCFQVLFHTLVELKILNNWETSNNIVFYANSSNKMV